MCLTAVPQIDPTNHHSGLGAKYRISELEYYYKCGSMALAVFFSFSVVHEKWWNRKINWCINAHAIFQFRIEIEWIEKRKSTAHRARVRERTEVGRKEAHVRSRQWGGWGTQRRHWLFTNRIIHMDADTCITPNLKTATITWPQTGPFSMVLLVQWIFCVCVCALFRQCLVSTRAFPVAHF